jgi:tetratricopeptide (TPR) repeat protein
LTGLTGKTFGMIGALASMPRRIAARQVENIGGKLRRGIGRNTDMVVVGRSMLERYSRDEIEHRLDIASEGGYTLISENALLTMLGLLPQSEAGIVSQRAVVDQSGIGERELHWLSVFDAFMRREGLYTFRDVILARKYARLIAGGATWYSIAKSISRSGNIETLTSLSLESEGATKIYARFAENLGELDGQFVLPIDRTDANDAEACFEAAEEAEAGHQYVEAARLYGICLAADPDDSVAAFNRANCLRAADQASEAATAYLVAIKNDPGFVDAWFNYACLLKDRGDLPGARRKFSKAIELDGNYLDAIYNLAALEFDAGNLDEARLLWQRYLRQDHESVWARNAERGIQYIDLHHMKTG